MSTGELKHLTTNEQRTSAGGERWTGTAIPETLSYETTCMYIQLTSPIIELVVIYRSA